MTRFNALLVGLALALTSAAHAQQITTPITPPVGQPQRLPGDVLNTRAPNNFSGTLRVSANAPVASGGALRLHKMVGVLQGEQAGGARAAWRLDMASLTSGNTERGELSLGLRATAGWRYRLICEFDGGTPELTAYEMDGQSQLGPGQISGSRSGPTQTAESVVVGAQRYSQSIRYTWARRGGVSRLTGTIEATPRDMWLELRFHNVSRTQRLSATFYACEVTALS